MSIYIREIQDCNAFEMVCEQSVNLNDQILELRFNLILAADGVLKNALMELGNGDNHIFTRNIQNGNDGYINSVTKFGPKVKGASILVTSAQPASKSSVIVTGSIDDVPLLPMAFVNKLPGKPCLACGEEVMHSPLLTFNNKEPSPVIIDTKMLPAIEKLEALVKSEIFMFAYRSDSRILRPEFGGGLGFWWPGKESWCLAACFTGSLACIAGTSGLGLVACLVAQATCEAACLS